MNNTDYTTWYAHELLAMYRKGEVSPVEVTQATLQKIEKINPMINAYCYLDPETTLAQARASESHWQAYRTVGSIMGLLEGVPASVKDLLLTQGWPTLRGSKTIDPKQAWEEDAPSVAQLREAGAVLLGKTTTPEFGCKGQTNSPATGITRNPWNLKMTAGGSSGGTAAAVAAGLGPIGLGTDGAGSVRIPAAFCGNVGFKPSFGRVPAYPLSPFGSVAHVGPHAMCVRDIALMMNAIKRPDPRDWTALPEDKIDYTVSLEEGILGLRVAYSKNLGYVKNIHPEVARAVDRVATTLHDLGAWVDSESPQLEKYQALEISTQLWFAGAWAIWNSLSPEQQALTDPDFRAEAMEGSKISTLEYLALQKRRGELGSYMRQYMLNWDILLTPAVAVPAFPATEAGATPLTAESMLGWTPFSYPFNLSQQPAITIPCGLTSDGLPIGVQLVGRMFADNTVLRCARAYESARPEFQLRPNLDLLSL